MSNHPRTQSEPIRFVVNAPTEVATALTTLQSRHLADGFDISIEDVALTLMQEALMYRKMTTPNKTLYREGDQLALKIDRKQVCRVIHDQQPKDARVWVMFANMTTPISVRDEDVEVYGGELCSSK